MPNTKNQIKTLTLFVLDHFPEGASAEALMSALFHAAHADPTDLADVFEELGDSCLIEIAVEKGKKTCNITAQGRMILPELADVFAPGVLKECEQNVLRMYEELTGGVVYSSEIVREEHTVCLICQAEQKGAVLAEVKVAFDSMDAAMLAKRNFEKRPQAVTNGVRALVVGDANILL